MTPIILDEDQEVDFRRELQFQLAKIGLETSSDDGGRPFIAFVRKVFYFMLLEIEHGCQCRARDHPERGACFPCNSGWPQWDPVLEWGNVFPRMPL